MEQKAVHFASVVDDIVSGHHPQLPQQQPVNHIPVASQARLKPNLPLRYLFTGRERYLELGVPLYEASIRCDWKAAKSIIDKKPELVRYSITENGETALHVAASAKVPKYSDEFVKNLVDLMTPEDLALENEYFNTALYLATAAGNLEAVKIMVRKNRGLLVIPGAGGEMMPLYAAVLFGNYEVAKYLYSNSNDLWDDGWNPENRGWLLEKCVEGDMFDIAIKIVDKHRELSNNGNVLTILARKPYIFSETKSNIIMTTIKSGFASIGLTEAPEKERKALQLLRFIWEDISKKPKSEIDIILRGQPDPVKQDKTASERVVQAMRLQKLISQYIREMDVKTHNIPDSTKQDTIPASRKVDNEILKLENLISERLVNLHFETMNITKGPPDSIKQYDNLVFGRGDAALELQDLIFKHILKMHEETQKVIESYRDEDQIHKLQRVIFVCSKKLHNDAQTIIRRPANKYSSRVLFVAAETGNTNFIVELIRQYPDLLWKVNNNNQTIFHIAVKLRHPGVYNLLYEIGSMKDLITPLKDEDDNNMLHLAGKITKKKRLEDVSGAALQMQRELLWFKEVESMIPPSYRERKNKDGLTPRELFTEEHQDLITQGEKWMKSTASQSMVVAALIATIVFAAAFTVPGGYNQNDGIPFFYRKITFVVFVVADAISLFLSTTSILTFLSILTSRYAEDDFLKKLPNKLLLGLSTLFLSITTMMITFGVSFFILYHREMKWIPILIGLLAVSPVFLYVVLQYHLLVDVIRSTYGSKYLFKPWKQVLYFQNPRV